MNIEVGDGKREDGRQEKDFVNAAVGWGFPFRGLRGERGEEEAGKKNKGNRGRKVKGKRRIMNIEYRNMNNE